jgi:hypothetical protein
MDFMAFNFFDRIIWFPLCAFLAAHFGQSSPAAGGARRDVIGLGFG